MKRDENEILMPVERALALILETIRPLPVEPCGLAALAGRVIAEDIISTMDIPMVDNSAMDGYAVRTGDVAGAGRRDPVGLDVIGELQAGAAMAGLLVEPGRAVRIMTGAPIPPGADAVVRFEDTEERGERVSIFVPVVKGENIRRAGEDLRAGAVVLGKGARILSADIGLLASINVREARVYRRPTVAVISTGDEVVEPGPDLLPGQVRNSNAYTLVSEIARYGCEPRYLGIVRDSLEATRLLLGEAMGCNVIVTTGGVSMGRYDFVKDAIAALGVEILIQNIRMKPGKPCVFGTKGPLLFFGLPGNPVSTMVSFIQFVRPALFKLMGAARLAKPVVHAVARDDIVKKPGRVHFIRGLFTVRDGEFYVSTTGPQGSGILRSMSAANCLIVLPAETERVRAGERVLIQLIQHEEI
ncbi:MAG: molybdopterin molybdenumtransferase MoeA [Spirochaetes bacterium]|nr:MAG: molybdopterin molybdenumtransferase MoeA [Spirochaetota bacterium]